ncbi:MAG: host attachment protein [Sulfurimonas sp.]|uniref:host attachment protein n=1 Tax=Sulfurimonas sp. TaxID=2022749 RepID=UPI0026366FB1|nr:host attachment protein [Sulfurimonas sp.]MCW8894406.1 host attachment protein [Sulfurimonas sp.]MCW8953489.1 host attachment protein [Sulfurimonas sp.]MCW9068343.1 host attachment protein [Sulfurimonas sp.]
MNFNGHIIVVGDLGQLKAYRISNIKRVDRHESMQVSHAQHRGTEKESTVAELIFDIDYIAAHSRISEQMSDKAGRLGNSSGESHNAEIEKKNSILKQISNDIASIIKKESPPQWHLAFPKADNNKLNEKLDSQIKKILKKNIPADLTKIDKSKLLSHFE